MCWSNNKDGSDLQTNREGFTQSGDQLPDVFCHYRRHRMGNHFCIFGFDDLGEVVHGKTAITNVWLSKLSRHGMARQILRPHWDPLKFSVKDAVLKKKKGKRITNHHNKKSLISLISSYHSSEVMEKRTYSISQKWIYPHVFANILSYLSMG